MKKQVLVIFYTGKPLPDIGAGNINRVIKTSADGIDVSICQLEENEVATIVANKVFELAPQQVRSDAQLAVAVNILESELKKLDNPDGISAAIFLAHRAEQEPAIKEAVRKIAQASIDDLMQVKCNLPDFVIQITKALQ